MFVPSGSPLAEAEFRRYAGRSRARARRTGSTWPCAAHVGRRPLGGKIDLLLADPVPVVSLHVRRAIAGRRRALRRAGSRVLVTVTSVDEARAAADADG